MANIGVPAVVYYGDMWPIMATSLECLAKWSKEGMLEPWLATSWEYDAKADTLTIHLRKGVKFQDGTDFNAEAVKWNVETYKALEGTTYYANIESIDVIDDYTVRFNYSKFLETNMMDLWTMMISPTAFETHGQEWAESHPVGTGAFKFVSWKKGALVKFERFDDYWGGKPHLDGVEWVNFKEAMVEKASLLAGEIDAYITVSPKDAKELEPTGKFVLVQAPGDLQFLMTDASNEDSPFSKLKVRQALSYAIDRQAICDAIGHGYWKPAMQYAIPGRWHYNPDVVGYPYNPEKARQLLKEAGYPEGFETTLNRTIQPPERVTLITAIQGYLADVGIHASINLVEFPQFGLWWMKGGWSGALNAWMACATHEEMNNWRERFDAEAPVLTSGLRPKELEDLVTQALEEPDFETRKALVHQINKGDIDKYCITTYIAETTALFIKYPYVHDTGFYVTDRYQWTPVDAWLSR